MTLHYIEHDLRDDAVESWARESITELERVLGKHPPILDEPRHSHGDEA